MELQAKKIERNEARVENEQLCEKLEDYGGLRKTEEEI